MIRSPMCLLLAALLGLPLAAQDAPRQWEHRDLGVLYAGSPGGSRETVFRGFLQEWFDRVETIHLKDLDMTTAQDWDVVIADWVSQYGNDGYPERDGGLFSAPCTLGPEFTKPVVAMTYAGTQIRSGYKLDWL